MESMCIWCGEPSDWHRLLGVAIDNDSWHRVWTGKGVSLVPSDAWQVTSVEIPRQRTKSPKGITMKRVLKRS